MRGLPGWRHTHLWFRVGQRHGPEDGDELLVDSRQGLLETLELFAQGGERRLAELLPVSQQLDEVRGVGGAGAREDLVELAEGAGHTVEVLARVEARLGQVIEQALDGRRHGVGGGRLGRPADGHEEERQELEAAFENPVHCDDDGGGGQNRCILAIVDVDG